jgi:ADP-heptose:LPS heptosyltransferase
LDPKDDLSAESAARTGEQPLLMRREGNQIARVRKSDGADIAVLSFGAEPSPRQRQILVLKLDHIGDFLMTLPALEKLRRAFAGDRITLLCGPWNVEFARGAGIADDIHAYRFFPEDAAAWDGEPVEGLDRFRELTAGPFDIAIDLRAAEDTRFLLDEVEAGMRCGIGLRSAHPYLDVLLPMPFGDRLNDPALRVPPNRFQSIAPVQTPLYLETDFSTGKGYIVFGPDLALPAGRFRVTWDMALRGLFGRFPGIEIVVDVALQRGGRIVASRSLRWPRHGDFRTASAVEFTNDRAGAAFEFRVYVRRRPLRARLRFFGVWVERIDRVPTRFRPAETHVGEQLSQLVQLVEDRALPLRAGRVEADPSSAIAWPEGRRRIAISPLSSSRLRDWGLDHYARLVRRLLDREDCAIVLVGSAAQRDRLDEIAGRHAERVINLAGETDWRQTAAVIREADLVISNNSGVGHLASACGTPTLAIYSGSHQPQEWGPRGPHVRALMALVPCSPCGYDKLELCPYEHRCMRLITPEAVAAEALDMLSAPRDGGGGRA